MENTAQMSQSFLGKQIDGVWHTGVVVFGKEFFFGGGIQHGPPGRTPYGVPVESIALGDSHIPEEVFLEFLQEISSRFGMDTYDLLHNNCNNFTNECAIFLTGSPIPEYITSLPSQVLNTPLGERWRGVAGPHIVAQWSKAFTSRPLEHGLNTLLGPTLQRLAACVRRRALPPSAQKQQLNN